MAAKTQLLEFGAHITRLREDSGISGADYTPHSWRHGFGTRLICVEGRDAKSVSVLMGHSSVAITLELYAHPTEESLRAVIMEEPRAVVRDVGHLRRVVRR